MRFPAEVLQRSETFKVVDLWSATPSKVYSRSELQQFRFSVKRDKAAGGGLAVYALIP